MLEKYGRVPARLMLILVTLVLLAGCGGEGSQAILNLVPLQMQMVAEYGAANMVVEMQDGNTLGFTVVDDISGSLASEQRVEQAREIAEFACEHYRSMDRIDRVWVAFEVRRGHSLSEATGSISFSFEKSELACGGG